MKISKIAVNTAHQKWCQDFMNEQNKSTKLVRQFLKRNSVYNPFSKYRDIENLLKRYEKSFWG